MTRADMTRPEEGYALAVRAAGDGIWDWDLTDNTVRFSPRWHAILGDAAAAAVAGSLTDVTDRRQAQLRLHHEARHDPVTGLPNRSLLLDRVALALLDEPERCAVMLLDVDRFELVNDSLGHDVGNRLLVALAARLAGIVGPGDTLARLGADEFAVLAPDIAGLPEAVAVVDAVQAALDAPFEVDGHQLFVTTGIGIAFGGRGVAPAELIGNADMAMRSAKRQGCGRSTTFDAGMRRRAIDRLARESELRRVVAGAQLAIHYQPIVSLRTGALCGLEALARWPEGRGAVPPAEFIPIAEDTGMIGALGRQVLRAALRALAGWRRDGLIGDEVCMSVNLSARQLDDPGLADHVRAAIAAAGLPADALTLEITESTLIADVERSQRVFAEVCAAGVGLHLDDFGTGYSSLAALHRFPVDALKIDRSFVAGLAGPDDAAEVIVRSTVAMAHSLGLPVIAEGIEHPAQLQALQALGCDFGQGHLFSPALDADDMRALLGERACRRELVAA